jgi:acyl carrier protein phosphodiesterase
LGDFVKGRALLAAFEPAVAKGIELHRGIDFYTDHHALVEQSKSRLRPKYHHYSGVIVDMFYDHFLAANWSSYHPDSLSDFANFAYRTLQENDALFPEQARYVLPYIIRGNWLLNYATVEGIHRALSGMARRTMHESKMEEATEDLKLFYSDFKKEFTAFFPDLKQWANRWLSEYSSVN